MLVKIQHRRGNYTDYDASKVLPGEIVVTQSNDPNSSDGQAIYIGTTSGTVKQLATHDDIEANNAESAQILSQVQQRGETVRQYLIQAQTKADEASTSASQAATSEQNVRQMLTNAQSTIDGYTDDAKDSLDAKMAEINSAVAQHKADLATQTQQATQAINSAASQHESDLADQAQQIQQAIDDDYTTQKAEIDAKVEQILRVKTEAENIATQALNKANELETDVAETSSKADRNTTKVNNLQFDVDSMIHGWYVDVQKRLIFTDVDGNPIGEPIEGIGGSGGGGGGSSTNAEMSATNTTGWISHSISAGDKLSVKILWTSIENDMPTGNGVLTIRVNSLIKASYEVPQGEITIDLTNYLNSGTNNVKITVTDSYDQQRTLGFNITVADFRITSNFNTAVPFEGAIPVPVTPYGEAEKTLYWELDGVVAHTQQTSASGRQITFTLPAQSHGAHRLKLYFEAELNNQTVRSNELYYEFISLETMNSTPIIISSYNTTEVNQYESVIIPYRVYTPDSDTTEVKLYLNNTLVSSQTVDRTEQSFTFRANDAGTTVFKIVAGKVEKSFTLTVHESEIHIEPETEDLVLYLSAQGRSNNEETRDVWVYNDIVAQFSNFTWRLDGWQRDTDGITVLRLNDKARLTIPYKIFEKDFKTTGKTIEIEFATRDVVDYEATILSCMSDGVGLTITPQSVYFAGAQTNTNTLYKDNEHIRLSIVIEKQTDNRLILIYINGVMSRAIQYASGERFSQLTPVDITIGSNDCGIDIYTIRVYDNNLTRKQILTNWIADTQLGSLMLDRYDHNNVYDASDNIPIANLPKDLPYMILEAEELPQFKGDKKTIAVTYTDPIYASKSFRATGVQANVQGTSSAPYYRKNYDLQFKNGFVIGSTSVETYGLRQNSIPFNRFVIKADVASSESTNNTGLTMFYNDSCPYKTPEMVADSRVRWGIEGVPIVVYWYDTVNQTTNFLGKYNFNLPKRAPTPLGYSGNMQSWEWQRNNSDNVKFKDDDFTSTYFDEDEQTYLPVWYQDFEARMPSDEWRDYAQLKELISWVKSTYRQAATEETFDTPITYRLNSNVTVAQFIGDASFTVVEEESEGVKTGYYNITFTKDTPAYRLTKFRAELDNYFERESVLFYYLFTELFLMIDSRAKNMFIGFRGSDLNIEGRQMTRKAVIEPYDMDTAVGTNNSGVLMFSYFYEDTDTVSEVISGEGGSNAPVYNAQDSVLWNNVRDAFRPEMIVMYRNLRSSGVWSYQNVKTLYEQHQAKWPEAVFNEDAYIKYIVPLVEPVTVDEDTGQLIRTDRYLTMLQGSKAEQRKWWLYNRFKYLDSKYTAGTANTNIISARLFADGTITVTPNTNCYVTVQFGGGNALNSRRMVANTPTTFNYVAPSGVTEMETYIYSADLISDIGDMSGFYPNEVDFSRATKIRHLKLGDSSAGYSNANLRTFDVRNSTLLETIDVRNCPNLAITVNLENSPRLKEAYFDGTAITGADFADGGSLQKLHLPATITTLVLLNLNQLTELQVASYANISRLMLANMDDDIINPITVLRAIRANSQVNIQGLYIEATDAAEIESILDLFDTMRGVTREKDASGNWLYYDYDTAVISGEIHTSSLTGAEIAAFNQRYPYIRVTADHTSAILRYYNGTTLVHEETILDGANGVWTGTPSKSQDAQYTYTFAGWSKEDDNTVDADARTAITADRNVYACFTGTLRKYTVTFVRSSTDGGGTLQTIQNVTYGTTITAASSYTGSTPTTTQGDATDYPFEGWEPASATVTGNTTFTAKFGSPIEVKEITDSWDTIIANIDNGTYSTKYKIGNYKPLDLGTEGTINMQIVAMDADKLASGGTAPLTFVGIDTLMTRQSGKSWANIKSYLNDTIEPLIPQTIRARLQTVFKNYVYSSSSIHINDSYSKARLWIPSAYAEVGGLDQIELGLNNPDYSSVYSDRASRKKHRVGDTGYSLDNSYYLRDNGESSINRKVVSNFGRVEETSSTTYAGSYEICLGFCLGLEPETIEDD